MLESGEGFWIFSNKIGFFCSRKSRKITRSIKGFLFVGGLGRRVLSVGLCGLPIAFVFGKSGITALSFCDSLIFVQNCGRPSMFLRFRS